MPNVEFQPVGAALGVGRHWREAVIAAQEMQVARWWDEEVAPKVPKPIVGKRGEELFHLILSGIREIYDVDATIAGGAVRDFFVDPEGIKEGTWASKDVDVFIPLTFPRFKEGFPEMGWAGGIRKEMKGKYVKSANCPIPSTARASSFVQGMAVDLIFMEEPLSKEAVDKFPIHAQRCVWTLDGGTSVSPEALKDLTDKTFTIDPTITDKERIKGLLLKIADWKKRKVYKDWKAIEPDIKEWWEAKAEIKEEEEKKTAEKKSTVEEYIRHREELFAKWVEAGQQARVLHG